MCLITRQKKAKILKKDLIVFKFIKENNFSSYHHFWWEKRRLYLQALSPKSIANKCAYEGDFSYADCQAQEKYEGLTQCYHLSEGFHSCLTKQRAKKARPSEPFTKIVKFLIPKGSKVFYDATELVVSNQIMML